MNRFYNNVGKTLAKWNKRPGEMVLRQEAINYYTNWYCNRFNYFDPGVREYANRSRDQLLRIAMICATLRGRRYMDKADCVFAHELLTYAAATLEEAIRPQSTEQQCQEAYQQIIRQKGPQPRFAILAFLRKSYDQTTISKAETQLIHKFSEQFEHFQDDAPACDVCGSITVRNGTCYRCFNCGNSMGCS